MTAEVGDGRELSRQDAAWLARASVQNLSNWLKAESPQPATLTYGVLKALCQKRKWPPPLDLGFLDLTSEDPPPKVWRPLAEAAARAPVGDASDERARLLARIAELEEFGRGLKAMQEEALRVIGQRLVSDSLND